ncbi:hypothetical protein JAAARDRAFT_194732 [Jaapia argillacea MUCL 33604]|uniref:DUF302 domain-containing protein n=1 Tax=Jaapia argillacea MUCL 33604 TaxID=933084 RepID=A0A067PZS7_9AGAM|nr:hypothetical protein JAAARDRAFT_194732 [Jaapia argillacea MUCL 33604]
MATIRRIPFTSTRIIYETPLPVSEVLSRLDKALNRAGAGDIIKFLAGVKTREEVEKKVNEVRGDGDFVYFGCNSHSDWLNTYHDHPVPPAPTTLVYTLGNPLIAATMLQHELMTGLYVPPKILVTENENGRGTRVLYDKPSAAITVADGEGKEREALRSAAEVLDEKLERLVRSVTNPEGFEA